MIKKQQAHRGEKGINATARGYAIKARPGPEIQKGTSERFTYINVNLLLMSSTCAKKHTFKAYKQTRSHAKLCSNIM